MDRAVQKKLWWGLGTSSVALIALQTCNAGSFFNCGLCDRDKCHSLENRVLERKAPECDCRFGHFQTEWTPWAANCPPGRPAGDCVNGQCARNPVIPQPGWSNSYQSEVSAPQSPAPQYEQAPYIPAPTPLPAGSNYHLPQYPVHQDVPYTVPGVPYDYPRVTDPGLPLSIPNQALPIVKQPGPALPGGNFSPMIPAPAPMGTGSPNPMPVNSVPMNPMQGMPAPRNDIAPPTRSEIPGDVSLQRRMPVQPTGHWQSPNWQSPAGSWQSTPPNVPQTDQWRVMPGYNGPQSQQPTMSRPFFLR